MGISSDGQICYGIIFEEEFIFPWDKKDEEGYKEENGDIEDWWLYDVLKYKPSFEIWNDEGEYLNGVRPDQDTIDKYYKEKKDFLDGKECPIKLVIHCSYDYPMFIIAIKESYINASRGYPEKFDLNELKVLENKKEILTNFCKEHNIQHKDKPCWILSSIYG